LDATGDAPEMENEFLKVKINADGTLDIHDKETRHEFKDQHYFEESGESGIPWVHEVPQQNRIITTRHTSATIEQIEKSEFLNRYLVKHTLVVPTGLEGTKGNFRRSKTTVKMPVSSTLTLRKGQCWLDVHTRIDNQAENHRVRACFPTNIKVEVSAAEAAFDVIERPVIRTPDSLYYKKPNPQYPMHRFVDMSDQKIGLAVINDGIREYEAIDDPARTLAITLFRGFVATQSPVLDQWDDYPWMKLSQSLGINEWRYAIMPHAGNWRDSHLYREAEKYNLSLETAQAGNGKGDLPKQMSFVEIDSDEIALSSLKKHEQRESVVLRLFNPSLDTIDTKVKFHLSVKEAWLTNMNEERKDRIPLKDKHGVDLSFGPKKIVTFEVVF
jgi:alpha-mannosidase